VTAVLAPPAPSPRPAPALHRLRWAVSDALTLTKRNLIHNVRSPELLVFATIQPVMFVLLFRYVFGGAIATPGVRYVDYLMPGIFVQTTAFASTNTGVGLAEDLTKGIIDRFRSLPMARSAVLAGRTFADLVRMVFVVLVMTAVGVAVGLRFHVGVVAAVAALAVTIVFGFAMSWISATIGMLVTDVETANVAGFIWLFPLTFASSAFVPLASMPGWLQAFAKVNPVTNTCDAARALIVGGPTARPLLATAAWIVGILVVFVPLSVARYRRVA
jgi:ABC transporter DrrB family efflux protein